MAIIDVMDDLRGIDLNLLVSLQVLLEERHVTRSADRLGVTQPAMSATLARLRALFDDPLLVRGAKGLTATPRAEALVEQLALILSGISRMVALPSHFIAKKSQRTFSIIGTDFIELTVLPRLLAALAVEAPHLKLHSKGPDFKRIELMMTSGSLDLAIGFCPGIPDILIKKVLFREPFVCIARRDHPSLGKEALSLDRYVEMGHVQALPQDSTMYGAAIDTTLATLGHVRKVTLWQASFLAIPSVVAACDLISTIPITIATRAAREQPIEIHEVPFALVPAEIALYWHPRHQEDAGHKWLRERIIALFHHSDRRLR